MVLSIALMNAAVATADVGNNTSQERACWGQATAAFAAMGMMGEHASQQDEPRDGLYNLAYDLWDEGVIEEPTLQALGAFLATALDLSIEACM
jgi:hypothetical protein